ncbi:MAG: hypothetical protein AAGG00_17620, partial [Cyanobacteria bacterium P01_H01_bin.150]
IQSQTGESQSNDNLVESDNQIVQQQSITTSQQPQFDSTTTDNLDIYDSSTVIQPRLDNQSKLPQQNNSTSEQKPNNLKPTTTPDDKLDDNNSEFIEIVPSNPIDIQARLDNQSLPILKPLTKSSPLVQESDFLISKLVTEFPDEISLTSNSNTSNIGLTENKVQTKQNNFNEQFSTPKSSEDIPEEWSNISELLSATSQALASTNSLISRNFYPESESSPQQSQIDNFNQESINLLSQNTTEKIPEQWSNISQLIREKEKSVSENNVISTSIPAETSSIQLLSPFTSTSSNPTLNDSNITSKEITQNLTKKDDSIDEQQLEFMAQQVYAILQQRLEIECERQGKKSLIYQSYFNNELANKQKDDSMNSPFDKQLQTLSQEVYFMLRQRIEIEQERNGN